MYTLVGSEFEVFLRIITLLYAADGKPLTEEAIAAVDFIAVHAGDFGIADFNLHGVGKYRFAEHAARRELVRAAIKRLVREGLVTAQQTLDGFNYRLSRHGLDFAAVLDSDYADIYYDMAVQALVKTNGQERKARRIINMCTVTSVRGG